MKIKFDLLEIKTLIEEKRLIFGLKFERFLLQKFNKISNCICCFSKSQSFALFGLLVIILISLYIRSSVDIGHDSGIALEIAQKILEGKKFNHDFIEYNFPLTFILLFPPILIAKFFAITPIIIADYYINLIALISIFWSYKTLKNSKKISNQIILNLIILSFTCGFFLRVNSLIFNEFLTKTSFLLVLVYPYFAYQIVGINNLNNRQKIIVGILMGMIVALKPTNIILIIGFEIYRFWKTKRITTFLVLHNYIFAIFLSFYGAILWIFFRSFLENFLYFIKIYNLYRYNFLNQKFFSKYVHFKNEYAMYFVLICFYLIRLTKPEYFNKILILSISALILIFSESFYLDQSAVFYALFLPLITVGFYDFVKQYKISLTKNWFIIISLAIFLFSTDEFFEIISCSLTSIFSILIALTFLIFRKRLFEKYHQKIKYCVVIFIFFVTLGFWGKFIKTILFLDTQRNQINFWSKSPNKRNDELMLIKKNYVNDNQNIITLNLEIYDSYPFRNYANIVSKSRILQYDVIKSVIFGPNFHKIDKKFYQIVKEDLLRQLEDKESKILINYLGLSNCSISILEYFMHDEKVRKVFTKNFEYLTTAQITQTNNSFIPKYTKEYLDDNEFAIVEQMEISQTRTVFLDEFEAYIRK